MKTAINAWSVRPDADFETAIRDVKAAGFDGIEFNVDSSGAHALTLDITDAELAKISALSEKYSLRSCSELAGFSPCRAVYRTRYR